jgi:hypothetical protein
MAAVEICSRTSAGYLVVVKSAVSSVESVVCQTSRGAVIAFAAPGIALPIASEVGVSRCGLR